MIYIVRHGQTKLNSTHALQGRSDNPMNETGIAQVQQVKAAFDRQDIRFSCVFSSPLGRAVKTAQIIAPEIPVRTDERLIEMDYGPYDGLDMKAPPPEIITFFSDFVHNPAPEGMEQLADVVKRTGAFIEEIRDLPGNILISTHAIAMKGILEYLTPDSKGSYWSKYIGNCAVYVTGFQNGRFTVPEEWKLL